MQLPTGPHSLAGSHLLPTWFAYHRAPQDSFFRPSGRRIRGLGGVR